MQQKVTTETGTTDLHIADFPLWLSFQDNANGSGKKVTPRWCWTGFSVRVSRKDGSGNACISDNRYITMSNTGTNGYHPTALGIIDSTAFEQYVVGASSGGNAYGDIPLESDRSVKLRLPAGELLLFQGVDATGNVVSQHNRLFALPPGHVVDTSVKRSQ